MGTNILDLLTVINVITSLRISFSVIAFSKGASSHKEETRGTKPVLAQFLQVVQLSGK